VVDRDARAVWSSGDFSRVAAAQVVVGELLCEAVDLRAGEQVLDVATGSGNTALSAARRRARVIGVDVVPKLLARARQRADAEELSIEFREGDAEQLAFEDRRFDCVLSTFGSMFADSGERAAREMRRVCRIGGRIGLACWTPSEFPGVLFRLLDRYLPPPAGRGRPIDWGTDAGLRGLFGTDVELATQVRTVRIRADSVGSYGAGLRRVFGPVITAFEGIPASDHAGLNADLLELIQQRNESKDGTLLISSEYLEAVITPPR
jgi:SAM-dependent methyltransferase